MIEEFNKKCLFDNILFKLESLDLRVGELEASVGVSPGYISRTSKDAKTKPGIDFIVKVAKILDVSIDTLVKINIAELTPTERYLLSFFDKLKQDTLDDKLSWNKESACDLNTLEYDINGYVEHPLFDFKTFYEIGETDYPDQVSRVVMSSNSFDTNTYIAGDCFNLKLSKNSVIYIMNISKNIYKKNDSNAFAKEIWLCESVQGNKFLCSNERNSSLSTMVNDLYITVLEFSKHLKIDNSTRKTIDSFMNDEEIVDEEDLPF